jgi:signal recognition particle subunit SRP54
MAFESLSDKLNNAFKKLKSKGKLTEADVKEAMREVRLALLEADVNFKVAKGFTNTVTERAIGADVMESLTPAQMVIKIVNEELVNLMGAEDARIEFASKPPTIIMLCGLQGAGKTTHAAKLGKYLKEQDHRPMLVACDIYRPAAIEQLKVVGSKAGVPVFEMGTENPVTIAKEAIKHAKDYGNDIVILDTAGRLHNKVNLMNELVKIKNVIRKLVPDGPHEVLLVLDGSTGQNAFEQAKQFTAATEVNALAITKLDGTAKGGVVIGISDQFQIPIKYIGVGEKIHQLQIFNRVEFVDSLFPDNW